MKSQKASQKVFAAGGASVSRDPEEPRASGATQEEIRVRAYEIYLRRGHPDGRLASG